MKYEKLTKFEIKIIKKLIMWAPLTRRESINAEYLFNYKLDKLEVENES